MKKFYNPNVASNNPSVAIYNQSVAIHNESGTSNYSNVLNSALSAGISWIRVSGVPNLCSRYVEDGDLAGLLISLKNID